MVAVAAWYAMPFIKTTSRLDQCHLYLHTKNYWSITLTPVSALFLKKKGPMMPWVCKPNQTVHFSECNKVWIGVTLYGAILIFIVPLKPHGLRSIKITKSYISCANWQQIFKINVAKYVFIHNDLPNYIDHNGQKVRAVLKQTKKETFYYILQQKFAKQAIIEKYEVKCILLFTTRIN